MKKKGLEVLVFALILVASVVSYSIARGAGNEVARLNTGIYLGQNQGQNEEKNEEQVNTAYVDDLEERPENLGQNEEQNEGHGSTIYIDELEKAFQMSKGSKAIYLAEFRKHEFTFHNLFLDPLKGKYAVVIRYAESFYNGGVAKVTTFTIYPGDQNNHLIDVLEVFPETNSALFKLNQEIEVERWGDYIILDGDGNRFNIWGDPAVCWKPTCNCKTTNYKLKGSLTHRFGKCMCCYDTSQPI